MRYRGSMLFPILLLALTIGLVLLMVRIMHPTSVVQEEEVVVESEVVIEVTEEGYQENVQRVMSGFWNAYQMADGVTNKISLVETTLDHLLLIRVPVSYQEAHLEMAFLLNHLRDDLWEESEDLSVHEEQFSLLLQRYSWIDLTLTK